MPDTEQPRLEWMADELCNLAREMLSRAHAEKMPSNIIDLLISIDQTTSTLADALDDERNF